MSGVPYIFGNATTSIPLSQLDVNFATNATIGTTSVGLGNTTTTLVGLTNVSTTVVNTSNVSANTSLLLQTNGGTTAVTIDTSQNVGVGVTPSAWNSAWKTLQVGTTASLTGRTNGVLYLSNNFYESAGSVDTYITNGYASFYTQNAGVHAWYNAPSGTAGNTITFTQGMILDTSGNLGVGTASAYSAVNVYVGTATNGSTGQGGVSIQGGSSASTDSGHASGTSSGTSYERFIYNGSVIGSITQNGTTGVLYNLTSDYRLKNNPTPVTGAKQFVMALQPKKWQWWDGSGEGVGFVAHEFMEVAKYSGHGEKDAVDADGKPVYQSIQPSSSEVMANLVSFIQELSAQVTTLQTQVTALKG